MTHLSSFPALRRRGDGAGAVKGGARALAPPTSAASLKTAAALGRALSIGALGGGAAYGLGVPLPFMLGSLFAVMAASLLGARVAVPNRLRAAFLVLLGLFLGEAFSAPGAAPSAEMALTLSLAALYAPLGAWIGYAVYTRCARIEPRTALFCAIPGGLSAVILTAEAVGADERRVALAQSLRIALVVMAAPALVFGVMGGAAPSLAPAPPPLVNGVELAWLLGGAALGALALRALGAPLPALMGPLLASAALRLAGVVEGALPFWLVETALVVTGASIGARFAGADLSQLKALTRWTVASTALLTALSVLLALGVAAATEASFLAALLAFAPGGVVEMCLIALALDADPAFVAAHHMARIGVILLSAPLLAHRLRARRGA
ncbi:MAG: AbrB family transcriptional regulator [Pseudomonadota bacterium]